MATNDPDTIGRLHSQLESLLVSQAKQAEGIERLLDENRRLRETLGDPMREELARQYDIVEKLEKEDRAVDRRKRTAMLLTTMVGAISLIGGLFSALYVNVIAGRVSGAREIPEQSFAGQYLPAIALVTTFVLSGVVSYFTAMISAKRSKLRASEARRRYE